MRVRVAVVAFVGVLGGLAAVLRAGDPAPPDRAKLQGVWEITSLIDNGEPVRLATVKESLAQDAQLVIAGDTLTLVRPTTLQRREGTIKFDPSTTPRSFDLSGDELPGSKGIYLCDGDTLMLCLAGGDAKTRPTGFSSPEGSHNLFVTLRRVTPTPREQPAPKAAPPGKDADLAKALVGTWGHQDDEKVEMTTLNADGTMSRTRTWKGGFRRAFHADIRSSGTWKVEGGVVVVKITASTDRDNLNQVYSGRICSINGTDLVYVGQDGRARREWKVR